METKTYLTRINSFLICLTIFFIFILGENSVLGQSFKETAKQKKYAGFFDFHYSESQDRIYLEVKRLNEEFLYVYSLSSGVGSNDIGLDRGQIGQEQIVYFKKAGNKLLLIQPNMKFRANTDNRLERLSIEQAFAKSVLFGFPILDSNANTYLIDITDFLLQDAHGVKKRLQELNQGEYGIDLTKSALEMPRTRAFPQNVEFEALLTFVGKSKGKEVKSVVPNPDIVSVIEHHSFIQLPDDNYTPRQFDPRSGCNAISYMDYATPVQESITKKFIIRHRLNKKEPGSATSEAVKPIIYYLDNGTPEPVRSALLEGGRWWNQAFEAIGYKDAFQIKILPDDADPLDVRYNVIQWVHRSTRGWSYGNSVVDPRTGEIIKGHVSLGSLRIRQDFLIAQALMNKPFENSDDNYNPMLEMALARIRQLSAHEIGHTLGFAHNFAASTKNRASVMDYPHPMLSLMGDQIDFSNAYDDKIGDWDKVTVAYAYSHIENDKKEALNGILTKAQQDGLRFITDNDARPTGGAHALAHLWDNGKDPISELNNVLNIRSKAIKNFSRDNIKSNEPYSVLEDVFVPLYFFHRYQSEAVVKLIGGLDYNYAVKGDGQVVIKTLDAATQKSALEAMLKTISTDNLVLSEDKLELFPPRAFNYPRTRESFKSKNGIAFDPLSIAGSAVDMSIGLMLNSERANRLVLQKSRDSEQLGLGELIDSLVDNVFFSDNQSTGLASEVANSIKYVLLNQLIGLANSDSVIPQVQAIAAFKLQELKSKLENNKIASSNLVSQKAYQNSFIKLIEGMKSQPSLDAPKLPDGSPIGMACFGG